MSYSRPIGTLPSEWKDINEAITGLAFSGGPGNKPDIIVVPGSVGLNVAAFDASTLEEVSTVREIQHDYDEGTDLRFHIHWMPTTADAGDVVWGLEYDIVTQGAVVGAGITTVTATATAPGVAFQQSFFSLTTIPGASLVIGDQFFFRLFRDAANGADTYPADASIATFGVHYQVNSHGSREITAK